MDEKEKKIKSSARPVTGPWKASSQDAGKPLVLFIYEKIESKLSRREIKKSIDSGRCAINGKTERFASTILSPGWVISLKAGALTSAIPRKPFNETEILYDDSSLLIYNKPAGISSDDPNLTTWLQKRCRRIILMHRLDKNTTGALLFAKNKAIEDAIILLFRAREVHKEYVAIADGIPIHASGIIEDYLGPLRKYEGQTIWGTVNKEGGSQRGQYAKTTWKLEKSGKETSLIRCFPETGRTHQLRVHLASIGHPILGDHQYGEQFKSKFPALRQLLHAEVLRFSHPLTKKLVEVRAPLPEDFTQALHALHLLG